MAFHNPMTVEIFDGNDQIVGPVTRPISITYNLDAFRFNYLAVQMETTDPFGNEVYQRFLDGEHLFYRITGRFGVDTGDINSVYKYRQDGAGELSLYGRCHKEIMFTTLGFPSPGVDVPGSQNATHRTYSGSELEIIRAVLRENVRDRLGVPIRFQTGDLGKNFEVDFRFDEIAAHLYDDSEDRGGLLLEENGTIIVDIKRDFDKHEYVLTARLQEHHEQPLSDVGGNISRYQATFDRGEASRVIVGGPGEMLDRLFADLPYPKTQYNSGAGQFTRGISDALRNGKKDHEAAIETARDLNKSQKEIQEAEKAWTLREANLRRDLRQGLEMHSLNKPAVPHPRRGHIAETFYENTSPDVTKQRFKNDEEPSVEDLINAMREAGTKKLEEMGPKGGISFTLNETDQVYLGPDGAFQMGDWVRLEADGTDFGEIQLTKAVASFTREDGYSLELSDTELTESAEAAQVDRIIKAMRDLTNRTRRA